MAQTDGTTEKVDVVAVGPHPDDLEIICGGTLAKLVKQGYRVAMIDLTTGEPTPRGSEEIRAREAEAAARTLGIGFRKMIGLPNRVLMDSPENRFVLATWLRRRCHTPHTVQAFQSAVSFSLIAVSIDRIT